jgi:hypothetical protein
LATISVAESVAEAREGTKCVLIEKLDLRYTLALNRCLYLLKIRNAAKVWRFRSAAHSVAGMLALISALYSWLSCRFRSRMELERLRSRSDA